MTPAYFFSNFFNVRCVRFVTECLVIFTAANILLMNAAMLSGHTLEVSSPSVLPFNLPKIKHLEKIISVLFVVKVSLWLHNDKLVSSSNLK